MSDSAPVKTVPAGRFKQTCLRLLDEVRDTREPIIVTKRGVPVAKIVPPDEESPGAWLGCMEGTVTYNADLVEPALEPDEWGDSEEEQDEWFGKAPP